ncbi:MAG: hypothetical protein ACREXT_12385, partial [Gammaproteobacteria bacterium]
IRTRDPSSSTAGRAVPPAKFSDNYALGQTLSFDALVEKNGGDGIYDPAAGGRAPLVTIEAPAGTLVFVTSDLPIIDGPWKHYDVPLSDDPAWIIVEGITPRALTAGEFDSVFGTMTRLTIISEWLKDTPDLDTGGLDNVTLSAIPVPAALPLLISALFGVGFAAKRRR